MSKPANKSLDVVDLVRIVRRFHIPELAAALATVISVAGLFAVAVTTDRAFPLKLLIGASGAALGAVIAAALLWNRLGATGTAMHPKVFLSHESAQKDLAERIRSALILHDVRVFDPDVDISLGERIKEKLEEGIRKSDAFVIILSPTSKDSKWVRTELDLARSAGRPVIPVVVNDASIPDELRDVRHIHYAALERQEFSPLVSAVYKQREARSNHGVVALGKEASEPESARATGDSKTIS
jgi:hypothetical protein